MISHSHSSRGNLQKAIEDLMVPLHTEDDFDKLIHFIKDKRVVMLGEASHGTEEFYSYRRKISQRLIEDYGFKFIAVEGDWPDAYRVNRYVRYGEGRSAKDVLLQNKRWPTWMWANEQVVKLAEWLRGRDVGFYGLDVYSLFDSIYAVIDFLETHYPEIANEAAKRYSCFEPYEGDEISYAKALLLDPEGCEKEVLLNLQEILKLRLEDVKKKDGEELFSAQQNAWIIANAETYYRAMIKADDNSWNVRDNHMMVTLDQLLERHGEAAKGIVWAHNTHIGDYRATDMRESGHINIGGLARQAYGDDNVALVGFGTYEGEVVAGSAWGSEEKILQVPPAKPGSYEDHFHQVVLKHGAKQFYILMEEKEETPLAQQLGHRAIGVVYDPRYESRSNYVPTELSKRYDAFMFLNRTSALRSLHVRKQPGTFPETYPFGQ